MATTGGSPSPVQLILVVENKTSKQEKEDLTPVHVYIKGKLASRWKKIRQKEGVNDVGLVQLLLDRFENTSHLFDPVPSVPESNTFVTSKGPIRITNEVVAKGNSPRDSDDEGETVTIVPFVEEKSTDEDQKNDTSAGSVQKQEDTGGTSEGDEMDEEANGEQTEDELGGEDDGQNNEDDWDSDPAGLENDSDSDEYKPESDSDWEAESDDISDEDWDEEEEEEEDGRKGKKGKKKKKNSQDDEKIPFKTYDLKEVAKTEGATEDESVNKRQRVSIKRLYWTELIRSYKCKVCSYQNPGARQISLHLLQEHSEMVGDLVTFLKNKSASDSKAGVTLYDLVLETFQQPPPGFHGFPDMSQAVGEQADNEVAHEETESSGKKEEAEMETAGTSSEEAKGDEDGSGDKSEEKEEDEFDEKEFVTLLLRWVEIQVTCQHCQQEVCRSGVFTHKGRKVVHQCRSDGGRFVLCDICGKSFSHASFKSHWRDVHGESTHRVCPYCGKLFKISSMNQHINNKHNSKMKDKFPCGICGKGFKNRSARKTHEAIHKREKPHMCTYCGRRFTQASNMRYHMRQHTGEKPYRCDTCHVSFTHNVSLKNHLKKQHGIDLWEMGYTGGGRPKKQKVEVVASESNE